MNLLSRLFGGATHPLIRPDEYTARYVTAKTPHTLLDVRTAEEFSGGHIPGAVNISLPDLPQKLKRVSSKKPVILYCRSGNRSATAAKLL
ncbi:MAG TPA: rhodanese-like domain-containing protein, partial [Caldilineaceae bacterium]|nr:rhodanese-like domain-containing protein [Caldilineaceae bacterium]